MQDERFYPFSAVPLQYSYSSLQPDISEYTLYFHHDKHYQGYADKLNSLLKDKPILQNMPLCQLTQNSDDAIRNNAGGVYNHELYFKTISPHRHPISEYVADRLTKEFGSVQECLKQLYDEAMARFGSGYAWLVECIDQDERKKLKIISTANQDTPHLEKQSPIILIDVWEHAYYLDRQNRRDEYINAFFNIIDWTIVELRMRGDVKYL